MTTKLRSLRAPISRLYYHSTTHPAPPGPFNALESTILGAAERHIPEYGFSATTLARGAEDVGGVAASGNLFPRGAFELVLWHLWRRREELREVVEMGGNEGGEGRGMGMGMGMGVGERVRGLVWRRLRGNGGVVGRLQEALALMSQPSNMPTALHELAALSDEIWYLAGDTAVDTSWYTKRASLSMVYAASELFMTTDKSVGFKDTKEFLDRRLRDAQVVGETVGGLGQWVGFTAAAGVNVLRSKGVRI